MKKKFTQLFFMALLVVISVGVNGQNILIQVNSPASVAGQITTFGVTVGGWSAPLPEDAAITSDIVLVNDGSGATSSLGCAASPSSAYEGRIAFVRRGSCDFSLKAGLAEQAGAVAVIVVNNDPSTPIINMSAAEGVSVGIPVFMISQQVGEAILSALETTEVNMTLELQRPNDIGIAEIFSPLWFNSYATPQSLINFDTAWTFASRIFNISRIDAEEVTYSVTFNYEGEEVMKRTETFSLSARTDDLTYTPAFSIPVPTVLDTGTYSLVYAIESDAFEDENPQNNTVVIEFKITDGDYMQSVPEPNQIARICFEDLAGTVDCNIRKDWGHGAVFSFPPTEEEFTLYSVNMVVGGEDSPADLEGAEIVFYFVEVLNFSGLTNGTGATLGDEATNRFAGFGEVTVSAEDHNREIQFGVINLEEEPLTITSNRNYAGILTVPAGVLIGRSTEWINVTPELDGFVYYWPNLFYYDGVFQSRVFVGGVYMKLNFELTTTVDNQPLPAHSVKVFPNPAQDYATVELDFEKAMNATITLADISGKVIQTRTHQNVQKHTQNMDLGNLSSGTYIIRIATPEGTSTKKLLIVK